MKKLDKGLSLLFALVFMLFACQDEDQTFGAIAAPTNIVITPEIVGQDATNPNGDGSGVVNFVTTADDAISYKYVYNGSDQNAPSGQTTYSFSNLGVNTYVVTVVAYGTGGVSSSKTISVDVLATYAPPADLLQTLVGDGSKTWRIKSEKPGHFGLGPVDGDIPAEWYGAGPGEKSTTGMYDDRYVFNTDGTFTHIVNSINDDPVEDTSGTVFGRINLIDELGPHSEPANGADIENYPYQDYSENWVITAPGGAETINLTGLGFMGYYTGGNHKYEIFNRSIPNELLLRTVDGNSEFTWWFIITSEEEGAAEEFQSIYSNLVWEDNFDTDGAPDPTKWTYDLGTGTNGWGNNEEQTYTNNAENVIVNGGTLKIIAKANGGGYTSARLKSEDLYEFTYGRIEARAKLPATAGTWPAIWMLGQDYATNTWPACGEIDIMEHVGNQLNTIFGTLHYTGMSGSNGDGGEINVDTATTEFHDYVVEWTPDVIKIVVDNQVYHTFINSGGSPFNNDFFIILNVAMGGTFGGAIDAGFTESTMEIDYIRVYQ